MKGLFIISLAAFMLIGCRVLDNKKTYNQRITVITILEDDTLEIDNTISIIDDVQTFNCRVINGFILLPSNLKGNTVSLSYDVDTFQLDFDNLNIDHIYYGQEMVWEFIIDIPPIEDNSFKGDTLKPKYIYYLSLNPKEFGEGLEYIRAKY